MPQARFFNFSGGLQKTSSDFLRRDTETKLSVNVVYDTVGNVQKRMGYSQKGLTIETTTSTSTTTTSTSTTSTSTTTTSTSTTSTSTTTT